MREEEGKNMKGLSPAAASAEKSVFCQGRDGVRGGSLRRDEEGPPPRTREASERAP